MTQYPPPYNPTGRQLQPPPMSQTNGLGIAGFIVSLVGMVLCLGLICPIGVVLSGIALVWKPRGFAIAGLVLGLLGSLLWGILLTIWIVKMPSMFASQNIWIAQMDIDDHYYNHSALPDDATGQQIVSWYDDQWGMPYDYRLVDAKNYEIISGGPDMMLGTADDVVTPYNVSSYSPYSTHGGHGPFGSSHTTDTAFADVHDIIERTYEGDFESPAWHEVQNAIPNGYSDEWGNAIRYNAGDGKDYELRSAGADRQMGTSDDIVRAYTLGADDEDSDNAVDDVPEESGEGDAQQP